MSGHPRRHRQHCPWSDSSCKLLQWQLWGVAGRRHSLFLQGRRVFLNSLQWGSMKALPSSARCMRSGVLPQVHVCTLCFSTDSICRQARVGVGMHCVFCYSVSGLVVLLPCQLSMLHSIHLLYKSQVVQTVSTVSTLGPFLCLHR